MKHFLRSILLPVMFVTLASVVQAQEQQPEKLTHWLTPGEKLRLNEIGKNFQETDPPAAPIRNVAEFDRMQGALVRYPFGIPVDIIKEMAEDVMVTTIVASTSQQNTVTQIYLQNGVNLSNCNFLIAPTNSYWTRDYGPWFESDSSNNIGIIDFPYNRPRPYDDEIPKVVASMLGISWYGMNLIHTGGNYMTDGLGISSSTELVWEENPTLSHDQVAQKVHDYLGIEDYQVVTDPNGTYIDHIDCWGKFLAPDKILIRRVPPSHPRYTQIEATAAYWAAQTCSYGYNYRVYRVDTPNDQPYTNSLILNNKVLVPFMNTTWDDSAKAAYENAMPGYEILGFLGQASTPWESTDALHCRAIGIADLGLLYISHIPVSGSQPAEQDYALNADVIACSDSAVYNDSVLIWYRVNNGAYQVVPMSHTTGQSYTGVIPKQAGGSTVQYYLYAADASGRHATAPFMGADDPFTFSTVYTDVTLHPDTLFFDTYEECIDGLNATLTNNLGTNVDLQYVEESNLGIGAPYMWYVDPWPFTGFPYTLTPGDSVNLLVHIGIVTDPPLNGYYFDSLTVTSNLGTQYLIIALNDTLHVNAIGENYREPEAALENAYPNPMQTRSTIGYELGKPTHVLLEILNMNGNIVSTLEDSWHGSGRYSVSWNGMDGGGKRVPAGIYLYRLSTSGALLSKRLVVMN